jgi:hypothetical protein
MDRRTFSRKLLQSSIGLAMPLSRLSVVQRSRAISLRAADASPIEVSANFTGLGYEMLSVASPGLLSPTNQRYVNLVRGLGPKGVMRIGGIVADYTRYLPEGPGANHFKDTVITKSNLEDFAAFLRAVDWGAIWSVNFAQGTIEQAVEEAQAVSRALGSRLLAIELGNEVENYGKSQPFRKNPYTYDNFRKEFDEWQAVIARAVPGVPFAGPDTAQSLDWVERMARDASGKIQLLTTHYYRNGQRRGSAEQLLTIDPHLEEIITRMRAASRQSAIPWRMCEINSFSGGGLPGVSDTLVGALWTLNTMLLLAQGGCSGVNIETGGNQLGFISSYSPIQDDGRGMNSAGASYYGMLAFAQALSGCNQVLPLTASGCDASVRAYAFANKSKVRSVVIVNMSILDVHVSLQDVGMKKAKVLRLQAPAPESKTGVTFGNAAVDANGDWMATEVETAKHGNIDIPRTSAVVLRADHLN